MTIERIVRIVAGTFIVLSVILSHIHTKYWLFFTIFVGLNLFQSGITKWCLMEDLLKMVGFKSCCVENKSSSSEMKGENI